MYDCMKKIENMIQAKSEQLREVFEYEYNIDRDFYKFDQELKIMKYFQKKVDKLKEDSQEEVKVEEEMNDSERVKEYQKILSSIFQGIYQLICQ